MPIIIHNSLHPHKLSEKNPRGNTIIININRNIAYVVFLSNFKILNPFALIYNIKHVPKKYPKLANISKYKLCVNPTVASPPNAPKPKNGDLFNSYNSLL